MLFRTSLVITSLGVFLDSRVRGHSVAMTHISGHFIYIKTANTKKEAQRTTLSSFSLKSSLEIIVGVLG